MDSDLQPGSVLLNEIKNEFVVLNENIEIEKIHVNSIEAKQKKRLATIISNSVPFDLSFFSLLETPKPKSDQHYIHFASHLPGMVYDFVHVIKFDLKFSGDSSTVIEKGNTDYYPSFRTNRLYFKSYILPVDAVQIEQNNSRFQVADFEPEKFLKKIDVESDQHFHTYAMFDELDTVSIIKKIESFLPENFFCGKEKYYSFFNFFHFVPALNLPFVDSELSAQFFDLFEPLWIFIRSKFDPNFNDYITSDIFDQKNDFSETLIFTDAVALSEKFIDNAKSCFNNYEFTSNDELMLRRWRRINYTFNQKKS